MSDRLERFEARPGGSYRLVLTFTDPSTAAGKTTTRFIELVPNVRVVQAVDFVSDDPANAGTMTMTWTLAAVNTGTNVHIRADHVPAGISAENHAPGIASSLANLAAYVER